MPLVASRFLAAAKNISPGVLDGSIATLSDDKGKGKAEDLEQARSVLKWLSDWHLLAYLEGLGIFADVRPPLTSVLDCSSRLSLHPQEDVKLMARIASGKSLEDLAKLFQTPSWQTFLTIAEESGSSSHLLHSSLSASPD